MRILLHSTLLIELLNNMDKGQSENQTIKIILALDLIALKSAGLFTIYFFRLNRMVDRGLMIVKLGMVQDHVGMRV